MTLQEISHIAADDPESLQVTKQWHDKWIITWSNPPSDAHYRVRQLLPSPLRFPDFEDFTQELAEIYTLQALNLRVQTILVHVTPKTMFDDGSRSEYLVAEEAWPEILSYCHNEECKIAWTFTTEAQDQQVSTLDKQVPPRLRSMYQVDEHGLYTMAVSSSSPTGQEDAEMQSADTGDLLKDVNSDANISLPEDEDSYKGESDVSEEGSEEDPDAMDTDDEPALGYAANDKELFEGKDSSEDEESEKYTDEEEQDDDRESSDNDDDGDNIRSTNPSPSPSLPGEFDDEYQHEGDLEITDRSYPQRGRPSSFTVNLPSRSAIVTSPLDAEAVRVEIQGEIRAMLENGGENIEASEKVQERKRSLGQEALQTLIAGITFPPEDSLADVDLTNLESRRKYQRYMTGMLQRAGDLTDKGVQSPASQDIAAMHKISNMRLSEKGFKTQKDVDEFWRFQTAGINPETIGPDLVGSYRCLNIKPGDTLFRMTGNPPLASQATAAVFMKGKEEGEVRFPDGSVFYRTLRTRGGIIADDPGTGKTLTATLHLQYSINAQTSGPYYPSIIIAPAGVLADWVDTIKKNAPTIRWHVLHGSNAGKAGYLLRNNRITNEDFEGGPDNVPARLKYMFETTNPEAGNCVIITTHRTASKRLMKKDK